MADIDIRLSLKKADQVIRGIENINKALSKLENKTGLKNVNKDVDKLGKTSKSTGLSLGGLTKGLSAAAVGFAALRVARIAANNFLEFEKALAEVKTIIDPTIISNDKLTTSLVNASSQFGTSAAAQAKSFYQIISAGITDAATANEVLIQSNKLAVGGLTETAEAVRIITTALNVYGSETLTAEEVSDSLFQTVKLGVTRVEELAATLGQVLPVAKNAGVSLDEVNSALAVLTKRGVSTAIATTQLRSLLASVAKNGGRAEQILGKKLAPAFSTSALRAKGLTQFLIDLQKATGGNETTLFKLIGRIEGVNAVLTLGNDKFKELGDTQDIFQGKAGSTEEAFAKINDTAGKQIDILGTNLKNATLDAASAFADSLLPAIRSINEAFERNRKAAQGNVEALKELADVEIAREKATGTAAGVSILAGGTRGGGPDNTAQARLRDINREAEESATNVTIALLQAQEDLAKSASKASKSTQQLAKQLEEIPQPSQELVSNLSSLQGSLKNAGLTAIQVAEKEFKERKKIINEAVKTRLLTAREGNELRLKANQAFQEKVSKLEEKEQAARLKEQEKAFSESRRNFAEGIKNILPEGNIESAFDGFGDKVGAELKGQLASARKAASELPGGGLEGGFGGFVGAGKPGFNWTGHAS